MEPNHFSHNHGLVFHHLPQGSQVHCSACKSPASGDVYACRQCNHFLHQKCFLAPQSLNHPSHPLHSLTLMPSPTYPSSSFKCDSCNLDGRGLSYTCAQCEFDLHIHCSIIKHFSHPHALKLMEIEQQEAKSCSACHRGITGSAYRCTESLCTFNIHKPCFDCPRELRHNSHPHHDLKLQTHSDGVTCNACLKNGKDFAYTCGDCSYNLHLECAHWPENLTRSDHEHSLKLFYLPPYGIQGIEMVVFVCSVCMRVGDKNEWVYCCETCHFGTHLGCVQAEIKQEFSSAEAGEIEEELSRLLGMKMSFDNLLKVMRPKAEEEKKDEAYLRKMEMEAELRRRRHNLAMQRLQQASDSIDRMGRIGSTAERYDLVDRFNRYHIR